MIKLEIYPNEGYSASQLQGKHLTVGALREWLSDYDDEEQIVTYDLSNRRGASYGILRSIDEVFDDEDDEDDDLF